MRQGTTEIKNRPILDQEVLDRPFFYRVPASTSDML